VFYGRDNLLRFLFGMSPGVVTGENGPSSIDQTGFYLGTAHIDTNGIRFHRAIPKIPFSRSG
jgi:hypothetical protein